MFVQGLRRFSCVFVAVTVCSYDILCSHIADPSATVQASSSSVQKTKLNGDWVDPGDMLATDLSSFETSMDTKDKQAKAKEENAKKAGISAEPSQKLMYNVESRLREMTSNPPRNCELPYFKQLTRIMIESLERPGKHYATIELTEKDLETLNDFRDKDMDGERIYDVLDIVSSIFSQVNEDVNNSLTFWSRALLAVEYNKEIYAVLFIVVTIVLILLVFERHTSMSWLQQFWYFLAVLFIISIPWEWFRLYRKEFAKKQSEMIKRLPPHCSPNNMTISQSVSLWMSNLLTWREDECAKHQEAILVDPVWEVSPSQV